MAKAMSDYDQTRRLGVRQGTQFVKLSLRQDLLGFRDRNLDGSDAVYPDPATGSNVKALAAFRSYLKNVAYQGTPAHLNAQHVVRVQFSTGYPNASGTFFSPLRWNEKIKWLGVKINAASTTPDLMVYLEQSGSSFIRNQSRGTVDDPARPDLLAKEMTTYPVRHWFEDPDNPGKWTSKNVFGFGINARATVDPDEPSGSWQKSEFHEMPPAVSTWTLEIPLRNDAGAQVLNLDTFNDIELWLYNYYYARN
jgi:hypothetical protein